MKEYSSLVCRSYSKNQSSFSYQLHCATYDGIPQEIILQMFIKLYKMFTSIQVIALSLTGVLFQLFYFTLVIFGFIVYNINKI